MGMGMGMGSLPFSIRAGAGSRRAVGASTTLGISTKSIPITFLILVCGMCMTHAAHQQAKLHKMAFIGHVAHQQISCMIQGDKCNSCVSKNLILTLCCEQQYTCTVVLRTSVLTAGSDALKSKSGNHMAA